MNIAIVHPDLGLGGAERLIVDAAVGLQSVGGGVVGVVASQQGHKSNNNHVTLFTSHHEKDRAFEETVDGTINVQVYADWFPRTLFFGRFHILCAIIRMFIVTICIWMFHKREHFQVFLVDQVSAIIPLIRFLFPQSKIVFYLHFPDKLLVQGRESSALKRLYRIPFDKIEEWTTGLSDRILVNSNFTLSIYRSSFPKLASWQEKRGKLPEVLYPCINTETYDVKPDDSELDQELERQFANHKVIVSVNRFERKKGIDLLVKAFAKLNENPANRKHKLLMVLAGGYDKRVSENVEYLEYLKQLVQQNNLQDQTVYITSFTNAQRYTLLHKSFVLAYTPENEHFGIVPVEAMFCERCVVAVNSGGPLESIMNGQTGFLSDPNAQSFADAIQKFLDMDESEVRAFGARGKKRVEDHFSLHAFAKRLNQICMSCLEQQQ